MSDAASKGLWDSYYKKKCTIKSVNTKVALRIEDFYVNLEGIDVHDIGNAKNNQGECCKGNTTNANFNRRDEQLIGRRIEKESAITIEPKNILFSSNKRKLVYGSPGTGKTTLCKRLVYDFYINGIGKDIFTEIIWIPLRNLKQSHCMKFLQESTSDLNCISTNVIRILFETSGQDEKFWRSIMCDKTKNILYILDGWDEIYHLMEGKEYSRFRNVVNMFYDKESVIITTRPFSYVNVKEFDQVFEVTGFNTKNILRYTKKILTETNSLEQFSIITDYMATTVVNDLTSIPILLDIFLFCWNSIEHFKESLTITRLYNILFTKLWENFQERTGNKYTEELRKVLYQSFCILGQKWVDDGILDFNTNDFGLPKNMWDSLNNAPFVNKILGDDGIEDWYTFEFVHLTICEYFAALETVNRADEDSGYLKEFVESHKYNPRLSLVLQFTAGIFDTKNEIGKTKELKNSNLAFFFDCLEEDPFDLLGNYHYPLLCNCLAECNLESKREEEIYGEIFEFICASPANVIKFSKLPVQLIELIIKENSVIPLNLLQINFRLPCFSPKFVEYIKGLVEPVWKKFAFLCKQVSHCKESENYIYSFCKDLGTRETIIYENNVYMYKHNAHMYIYEHLRSLPSKMKIDIIVSTLSGRYSKLLFCNSLEHDFINENDFFTVCQSIDPKIKNSCNLIQELAKSSNGDTYFIHCLRFLKNSDVLFDNFVDYINKTLEEHLSSNRGIEFCENLFHWISIFKMDSEDIRKKLIFLSEDHIYNKMKQNAMLTLLKLYGGKDIPKNESMCICRYIQKLPERSSELMIILCELSLCGFLGKDEEEILKDWCIFNFHLLLQNKVVGTDSSENLFTSYLNQRYHSAIHSLVTKRRFNENQIRVLINNNDGCLKSIIEVLLNHIKLKCVTEFFSNLTSQDDMDEINFALSKRSLSEISDFPEYLKTRYSSEIFEIEIFLENYQEELRGRGAQNIHQICGPNCGLGIDSKEKLSLMALKFKECSRKERSTLTCNSQQLIADNIELLCDRIHDEHIGHIIYSALKTIRAVSPELFIGQITPDNFLPLFHVICRFSYYSQHLFPIYIANGVLYYGTFHSNTQYKIPSEYIENCITTLGVDRCCRNIRLKVHKDFNKFTRKAKLKDLDKLKTTVENIENIIQAKYSNDGRKYSKIATCQDVLDNDTLFDHQTKCELIKAVANEKFTEDAPLKNILLSFTHLDFSESNITDTDIFVYFLSDKSVDFIFGNNVHTLILSDNKITKKGFLNFLREISCNPQSKLKHLFLDRNYIFVTDDPYFIKFMEILTSKGLNRLEVLDISGNFISHSCIEKLTTEYKCEIFEIPESNFAYFLVNNCKLIFSRRFSNESVVPVVDIINGEKDSFFVDEKNGCVGIASQSNTVLGYSGHHLLLIEKIEKGQRLLLTAELFVEGLDKCTIKLNEVDPLNDLKKRMEKYTIKRGTFRNSEISKLIEAIKASKRQQDFFHYDLDMESQDMNCVKWVLGIMKTITEYKVTQVNAPPSTFIKIFNCIKKVRQGERLPPNFVLFCLPVLIAVLTGCFLLLSID